MLETVADLIAFLGPEPDEVAILSAVLQRSGGRVHLCRASLLIAPDTAGAGNWHAWQEQHMISTIGSSEPPASTYLTAAGDLIAGRAVLSVDEATCWLHELVTTDEARAVSPLPGFSAQLGRPIAPLRASWHLDTDASTFLSAAVRPALAFLFPGTMPQLGDPPNIWEASGSTYIDTPFSLGLWLGRAADAPGGILLGRLERRAWLSDLRGGADLETFDVSVGLDPRRIDVSDLSVSLDEWIDGELVHAQQLRLEDLDVDPVRAHPAITVQFPTLGTRVKRSARLYDRTGNLLDASAPQYLVEHISLSIGIIGSDDWTTTTVGQERPVPVLCERAAAVLKVNDQYRELFRSGAESTLLPPGTDVASALAGRLRQARGTLRVMDRYIGRKQADWAMFGGLSMPIEVLTSKGNPPLSPSPNLTVRWVKRPRFHGRAYLWDEGGLAVDNSPNGFGRDDILITPLSPAVSERRQRQFAAWWSSARKTP